MDAKTPMDIDSLRQQLAQAQERLEGLVGDLRAVDRELEDLSTERQQHRLLGSACDALEALGELGGAALFWGRDDAALAGQGQLRAARGRADAFEKRLLSIEDRRQAVLDEIQGTEDGALLLEEDLYDAEREAERRRQEWVIEREVEAFPAYALVMPWSRGGEDDERFRKALLASLLLALLLGLWLPWIELPLPERWEPIEVPERLARLIREERLPPPPPPVQQTKPEETAPKPPEELAAEPKPSKEVAPPAPKPGAGAAGILAFREKFSALANHGATDRLGARARISSTGEAASGRPTRSMVATQAAGSSGGINLAGLSRDLGGPGGDGLEGVQVARATSTIGGGGGAGQDRRASGGGPALGRTDEEIQIVFDRHKSALYRLYNRELRQDPTLRGQMVLRIRIEPDGSVSLCELQSSDMKAPQLAAQVLERVRGFDFGAKDVATVTILYPIDFLPAT